MKYFYYFIIIIFFITQNLFSEEKKCRDLRDEPVKYSKCIAKFGKDIGTEGLKKLNTDSKLTDWIREKFGK